MKSIFRTDNFGDNNLLEVYLEKGVIPCIQVITSFVKKAQSLLSFLYLLLSITWAQAHGSKIYLNGMNQPSP